jgi:hypothetical protein
MKAGILLSFLIVTTVLFGQNECRPYVPTQVGTTWEITNYSKKDKVTGTVTYELLAVEEVANGSNFSVKATFFDDKGKETYNSTYEAQCKDGVFLLDMTVMMDGQTMAAYQDMDAEVDATEFELPPTDPSASGKLQDGSLKIKVSSSGMNVMTMNVDVTNREIEGVEEITTPAGTFNCLKMKQTVSTRMIVKIEARSIEWYAEGVGMVRSESYNKKGKLTGYSVLTKME